jgi:hypothetical protein
MRLFQNDAQLAEALRALNEAGLIDIVAGDNGEPQFRLSAEIAKGTAKRPKPRQGGSRRWSSPRSYSAGSPEKTAFWVMFFACRANSSGAKFPRELCG